MQGLILDEYRTEAESAKFCIEPPDQVYASLHYGAPGGDGMRCVLQGTQRVQITDGACEWSIGKDGIATHIGLWDGPDDHSHFLASVELDIPIPVRAGDTFTAGL